MVTIIMMAVAFVLVLAGYSWQRGMTPDVERVAGRVYADVKRNTFAQCPRDNGMKFWMGCTDLAPTEKERRR
jgi:hypothetical protein